MPIYEFRCGGCGRRVSLLLRNPNATPTCPLCEGGELERLISSFAYHRSGQGLAADSLPPAGMEGTDYFRDPRNIGRRTEERLKGLGMDMRSEEYKDTFSEVREMIDAARDGEMPENIKDI